MYRIFLGIFFCGILNLSYSQIMNTKTMENISRDSLKNGIKVTITGRAENAKAGAIVIFDREHPYYISNLKAWSEQNLYKKVEVTGVVRIVDYGQNTQTRQDVLNLPAQTLTGTVVYLDDAVWKVIK
jgi:hypothetical protein